jgi:hypothetical protein
MKSKVGVWIALCVVSGIGYCTFTQCQRSYESKQQARATVQRLVDLARQSGAQVDLGRTYLTMLRGKTGESVTARERELLEVAVGRQLSQSPVLTVASFRDVRDDERGSAYEAIFECLPIYCPFQLRLRCSRTIAQELAASKAFARTIIYKCQAVTLNVGAQKRAEEPTMVIAGYLERWEPTGEHWPLRQDAIDEAMR